MARSRETVSLELEDNRRDPAETLDGIEDEHSTTSTLLGSDSETGAHLDLEKSKAQVSASQGIHDSNRIHLTAWMVVNTLATIGIVSQISQCQVDLE